MPPKLTILGSGSAIPTLGRGVSAQFLNFDERRILIDCGEGTQMQLRKFKVKFQRLRFIFISHLHGDHFLGIFGLLTSMNLTGRNSSLTIFGPKGLREMIEFVFEKSNVHLSYELIFREISAKERQIAFSDDAVDIFTFPVKHRLPTWGFLFHQKEKPRRIEKAMIDLHHFTIEEMRTLKAGRDLVRGSAIIPNHVLTLPPEPPASYAYCADTMYYPDIVKWVEGCQLLYHEATFSEADKKRASETMHSTSTDAARIARDAKVGKLILGHFSARYKDIEVILNEAIDIFPNTVCANDGDTFGMQPND